MTTVAKQRPDLDFEATQAFECPTSTIIYYLAIQTHYNMPQPPIR